jgi:hypothetical protein
LAFFALAAATCFLQKAIEVRHRTARAAAPRRIAGPTNALLRFVVLAAFEERAENPYAQSNQRDNQNFPVHRLLSL